MMNIVTYLIVVIGCANAQQAWNVVQPSLGTIMWGLDSYAVSEGLITGITNGPGNLIYRFSDSGESLETLMIGTQPGQPFWPTAVCSLSYNQSVVGGFGMGPSFPGSMFSTDGGYTYTPSTSSSQHWGLYLGCSISLDGNAVVLSGDWFDTQTGDASGAGVSVDGGDVYFFNGWGVDHWARFAFFINSTHGFISGGKYPVVSSSKTVILGRNNSIVGSGEGQEEGLKTRSLTDVVSIVVDDEFEEANENNNKRRQTGDYQACIAKTIDGGATWQVVYESFGDIYFNQIKFVSSSVGFVAGENNRDGKSVILRTQDGGATWQEVFRSSVSLVAMHFINENVGWVGGADYSLGIKAYFVQTTDAGDTWQQVTTDLPYSIWAMAGEVPEMVYAVGFNQATTGLLRYS